MIIETRGRKPNTTPLEDRVCKRGHVGQYRKRGAKTVACYECSKIAIANFRERGVAQPRVPLEDRVCKRGHVGKYKMYSTGYSGCTECAKIATKEYNDRTSGKHREERTLAKLTARREQLITELAELTLRITLEESIIKQRQERV